MNDMSGTVINGDAVDGVGVFEYPEGLDEKRMVMFDALVAEMRALYGAALTGDIEQITTICYAAQNEELMRTKAWEALHNEEYPMYDVFTRHARAEASAKKQGLVVLGLVGYARAEKSQMLAKHAANKSGAALRGGGDEWANLLPEPKKD